MIKIGDKIDDRYRIVSRILCELICLGYRIVIYIISSEVSEKIDYAVDIFEAADELPESMKFLMVINEYPVDGITHHDLVRGTAGSDAAHIEHPDGEPYKAQYIAFDKRGIDYIISVITRYGREPVLPDLLHNNALHGSLGGFRRNKHHPAVIRRGDARRYYLLCYAMK